MGTLPSLTGILPDHMGLVPIYTGLVPILLGTIRDASRSSRNLFHRLRPPFQSHRSPGRSKPGRRCRVPRGVRRRHRAGGRPVRSRRSRRDEPGSQCRTGGAQRRLRDDGWWLERRGAGAVQSPGPRRGARRALGPAPIRARGRCCGPSRAKSWSGLGVLRGARGGPSVRWRGEMPRRWLLRR